MSLPLHRRPLPWIFLGIHLLFQLLLWVDEGFYDFRWMSDPWNWFIYFIYTTFVFVVSWLASWGYSKLHLPAYLNVIASVFSGFMGITLLLLMLWYLK